MSMLSYKKLAVESLQQFIAETEFSLNKIHKHIASRVSDYLFILKTLYK